MAREANGQWEVRSAGSSPAGYVHPMAVQAMSEIGVDISSNESKHLDQFVDERFDLVVTVCGNADQDCPTFPRVTSKLHWPFDDPNHAEVAEDERLAAFRNTRDLIAARIREYLAQQENGQACAVRRVSGSRLELVGI